MHTVDEETKKDTQDYELCSTSNVKRRKELGPRQSRPQEAGKTGNLIEILFRKIVHSNEIVRPIGYEQSAVCRLVRRMRQRKNKRRRQEKSRARISHAMNKLLDVKKELFVVQLGCALQS